MTTKRKSYVEQYRSNTSKYTKLYNILNVFLLIDLALTFVFWRTDSLETIIFELLSAIFWVTYPIVMILDIKGRLKKP